MYTLDRLKVLLNDDKDGGGVRAAAAGSWPLLAHQQFALLPLLKTHFYSNILVFFSVGYSIFMIPRHQEGALMFT